MIDTSIVTTIISSIVGPILLAIVNHYLALHREGYSSRGRDDERSYPSESSRPARGQSLSAAKRVKRFFFFVGMFFVAWALTMIVGGKLLPPQSNVSDYPLILIPMFSCLAMAIYQLAAMTLPWFWK